MGRYDDDDDDDSDNDGAEKFLDNFNVFAANTAEEFSVALERKQKQNAIEQNRYQIIQSFSLENQVGADLNGFFTGKWLIECAKSIRGKSLLRMKKATRKTEKRSEGKTLTRTRNYLIK